MHKLVPNQLVNDFIPEEDKESILEREPVPIMVSIPEIKSQRLLKTDFPIVNTQYPRSNDINENGPPS